TLRTRWPTTKRPRRPTRPSGRAPGARDRAARSVTDLTRGRPRFDLEVPGADLVPVMPGVGEPIAEVLVGRQPIFDRREVVVGYELLFRAGAENVAGVEDADRATANVVMGALTEIGL